MDPVPYGVDDRYDPQRQASGRLPLEVDSRDIDQSQKQRRASGHPSSQSTSLGNGVIMTSSQRRRVSADARTGDRAAPPAAPDAPMSSRGAPPTAFQDLYQRDTYPPPESSQSSRSFSARANVGQVQPENALGIADDVKRPRVVEIRKHVQRGQPTMVSNSQHRTPDEPTYTSFAGPPPSQGIPSADTGRRRSTGQGPTQPYSGGEASRNSRAVGAMPQRSSTTRTSAGTPSDWAADRSPLQKLEVKLNDISKEEKRARVQEAEQRLRENRASASSRRASQATEPVVNRSSSRRIASAGNETQPQSDRNRAYRDEGPVTTRGEKEYAPRRSSTSKAADSTEPRASRVVSNSTHQSSKDEKSPRIGNQYDLSRGPSSAKQRRSIDGRADDRAVRFSNDSVPEDAKISSLQRPRNVVRKGRDEDPATQPPVRSSQVEESKEVKAHAHHEAEAHTAHGDAHRSHADGLKHKLPPQTEAGIKARQRIGFGNELDKYSEAAPQKKHHLGFLHTHKQKEGVIPTGPTRHLDEWREGRIARLMLADAVAPAAAESPKVDDKPWWEGSKSGGQRRRSAPQVETTAFDGTQEDLNDPTSFNPPLLLKCGPLLRYTGMKRERSGDEDSTNDRETWRGSVMIVTTDHQSVYNPAPVLRLSHQPMTLLPPPPQQYDESNDEELPSEYVDPVAGLPKITRNGGTVYVKPAEDLDEGRDVSGIENDEGLYEVTRTANVPTLYGKADEFLGRSPPQANGRSTKRMPAKSGRYREVPGVRLHAERGVTFWRFNLEIELGDKQTRIAYRINRGAPVGFWVPARGQSMNIMFHTCNGFSMSVDPNTFSGPDPLWRDVLNSHQVEPFHVMIGGGDQIYNDSIVKQTRHFQEWIEMKNPHHKREAPFTMDMQEELETFYLERYSMWFSQGLFGMANSQIPMINIWDDHDIIDGYGSYPDHFMSTPVFCGLGNVAFKYYMLFQHQSVPNELEADEPSWVLGSGPGPYISELSRSVFMFLGRKVAFLGLDCRTERTRDEVLSENSYTMVLERCRREIVRGETKHLIVLLGIPIAYPRLVWLETVLTSRALDPLKALGRMGLLGNLMNKFDGGVEILDDLDDHWTAKNHKQERNWLVEELQMLAAEKAVRITILSGDVHLAAIGQFYSNKSLKIPKDLDHRYIPNVISSAIVNTPPPDMVADALNRREKIHHLNPETDEDMIPMFTHDVDGKPRNNKKLLPKRNWCSISEYLPGSTPPPTPPLSPTESEESLPPKPPGPLQRTLSLTLGDSKPAQLIRRLSLSQKRPTYTDQSPSPPPDRLPSQNQGQNKRDEHSADSDDAAQNTSNFSAPLPIRPVSTFHRRPTNLSEKAAAKGGGDAQHVNLELGLDIRLHCEIKKGDPSGVTESYRLLVPALFYDGDVEEPKPRRPTLIKRLTSMRGSREASNQGQGNWGQSDSESEMGNNAGIDARPPGHGNDLNRPRLSYDQSRDSQQDFTQPQPQPPSQSLSLRSLLRSNSLLQKRRRPFSMSLGSNNKPEPFQARPASQPDREMAPIPPLPPQFQNPIAAREQQQQLLQQQQQFQQRQYEPPQMQQPQASPTSPTAARRARLHRQQHRQQHEQQHWDEHDRNRDLEDLPAVHNSTAPLDATDDPHHHESFTHGDGDEEEEHDEEEDSVLDDDSFVAAPRRRVAGKFDRTGTSKFFGAGAPGAGRKGGTSGARSGGDFPENGFSGAQQGRGQDRGVQSQGRGDAMMTTGEKNYAGHGEHGEHGGDYYDDEEDGGGGYSGIEAFKGEKKGWKRLLRI